MARSIPDADGYLAVVDPHQLLLQAEAEGRGIEVAEGG